MSTSVSLQETLDSLIGKKSPPNKLISSYDDLSDLHILFRKSCHEELLRQRKEKETGVPHPNGERLQERKFVTRYM